MHNPDLWGTTALKKIFVIILLFLSIQLFSNPVYSSAKTIKTPSEEFSPENISSFIKHLINNGEYYRAHVELGRLAGYYPGYSG